MPKKLLFILIPLGLIIAGAIFFAFYKGVSIPSKLMNTRLINKPMPSVKAANLYKWNELINLKTLSAPVGSPIGQWYLINSWASWCELCQEEQPFLMDLARQGVIIYGLNYQDKMESAKKMLEEQGNPYTLTFWDARGIAGKALGLYTVPQTFLVDPNGIIRFSLIDPLTKEFWESDFLPIIFGQNESQTS